MRLGELFVVTAVVTAIVVMVMLLLFKLLALPLLCLLNL
jgi:hypothetical protein